MLYETDRMRMELADGVATVWLNGHTTRNLIGREFLLDLDHALTTAAQSPVVEILVIRSSVVGVFATGPDLNEVASIARAEQLREYSELGQKVFQHLSKLRDQIKTVAVIEGRCYDAGLALALACQHRIGVAQFECVFRQDTGRTGMPPIWGETDFLRRELGIHSALKILAGKPVPAREAAKIGLLNHVYGERSARTELLWRLSEIKDGTDSWPRRTGARRWWQRIQESRPFLGRLFRNALASTRSKMAHHIAARSMMHGWTAGTAEALAKERAAIESLAQSGEFRIRMNSMGELQEYVLRSQEDAPANQVVLIGSNDWAIELATVLLQSGVNPRVLDLSQTPNTRFKVELHRRLTFAAQAGWLNSFDVEKTVNRTICDRVDFCDLENALIFDARPARNSPHNSMENKMPASSIFVALDSESLINSRLSQPGRCAAVSFTPSISIESTVEIQPLPETSSNTLHRLTGWLDRCGFCLNQIPVVEDRTKPAVFAA
jgi:enoyl-CoA hydratase/carnithine racemase